MQDHAVHDQEEPSVHDNLAALLETVKEYSATNLDLMKLKAADKAAEIVSSAVATIAILVVAILFLVIFSIALAMWIGDLLGEYYYGFFIIAGLYLIIGVIFNASKGKLFKVPVANLLIKKMFN